MKLSIINLTKKKLNRKLTETIKKAVKKTVDISGKNFDEINIIFMTDSKIKKLNKKFLNKNRPTDVIAFNYYETTPFKVADIYISYDTALKNSKRYSVEFETEVLILSIHGTLHIIGYDDNTKRQRKKMNMMTLKIIKTIFDKIA